MLAPVGSVSVTGRGSAAAGGEAVTWLLAEEVPVAIEYNGQSHAVMMATPADLEDFVIGFSLAEAILRSAADVEDIAVRRVDTGAAMGAVVNLTADPLKLLRGSLRRRSMEGRSGCGLCGVESLDQTMRDLRRVTATFTPSVEAVAAAFAGLPDVQPMNRANRSVHAAAWCEPDGRIVMGREDVGRHNALDKLIGALARQGIDPAGGFAVMTSRCSFELVQKAATVGIPLLATMSAPTALAFDLARGAGITLGARSRADGVLFFS